MYHKEKISQRDLPFILVYYKKKNKFYLLFSVFGEYQQPCPPPPSPNEWKLCRPIPDRRFMKQTPKSHSSGRYHVLCPLFPENSPHPVAESTPDTTENIGFVYIYIYICVHQLSTTFSSDIFNFRRCFQGRPCFV